MMDQWSDVRKLCYNVILLALSVECCIIHVLWPVGRTGDGSRLWDTHCTTGRSCLAIMNACICI